MCAVDMGTTKPSQVAQPCGNGKAFPGEAQGWQSLPWVQVWMLTRSVENVVQNFLSTDVNGQKRDFTYLDQTTCLLINQYGISLPPCSVVCNKHSFQGAELDPSFSVHEPVFSVLYSLATAVRPVPGAMQKRGAVFCFLVLVNSWINIVKVELPVLFIKRVIRRYLAARTQMQHDRILKTCSLLKGVSVVCHFQTAVTQLASFHRSYFNSEYQFQLVKNPINL